MTNRICPRAFALLLASLAGCGIAAAGLGEDDAALARLIAAHPPGRVQRLDLSDPQELAGYQALLRKIGATREDHPAHFAVPDAAGAKRAAEPDGDPSIDILGFATDDAGATVGSTALVRFQGEPLLQATLSLAVLNAQSKVISNGSKNLVSGPSWLAVTADPKLNPGAGSVTAVATVSGVTKTGAPMGPFFTSIKAESFPIHLDNNAPTAPAPGPVQVCINRTQGTGSPAPACDAILASAQDTPGLLIPVAGSAQFPADIDLDPDRKPAGAQAILLTLDASDRPACASADLSDAFFAHPNTVVRGGHLAWSMSPATFGLDCPTDGRVYHFALSLRVNVVGKPAWATVTSLASAAATSTVAIPPLKVTAGCIAAETPITMGSGKAKMVNKLNVDDTVKSAKGALTLVAIASALQSRTVTVTFEDEAKVHSVTLSLIHPVVTARGIVQAQNLRLDDQLTTLKGQAKVTRIDQQVLPKPVQVFDLVLMPETGSAEQGSTLFAGGILVGDGAMKANLLKTQEINQ
jgi:hypothetical protein